MTEPRRLRDSSGSDLERALLDAGKSFQVTPETRARTIAALGLAGASVVSVSAATAGSAASAGANAPPIAGASALGTSSAVVAKVGWLKWLGGALAAGALAGVPIGYALSTSDEPAASTPRPSRPLPAPPPPAALNPEQPAETPAPDLTQDANEDAKAAVRQRREAKPEDASAALRAELTQLDAARRELANGAPQRTLVLLDAYDRAHPRGRLKLEAEVLRIDALAKSGRGAAASRRAELFLSRYPKSVLASRVRGYVDR